MEAFRRLADVGAEVFGVALYGVEADGEQTVARVGVDGVAQRALGVGGRVEDERAAVEVGAFGVAGHHAAGVTGAEEEGIGTADGFDAFDIKGVEQRGVGAEKSVTAGIVNLETAHRHALRVLTVALEIAAHILVAGADDGGTEAAEFCEHLGGIDDPELVHQLAVENFGVEGRLAQGCVGAGDGVGVGGVVGVVGIGGDLKRVERNCFLLRHDGGCRRFGTRGGCYLGGERGGCSEPCGQHENRNGDALRRG